MGNITNVSSVLLDLGLSASVTDEQRAIANQALKRAESSVKRFLGYDPLQSTRTEYYPQMVSSLNAFSGIWDISGDQAVFESSTSANELQLKGLPIRSITNLYIDHNGRNDTQTDSFSASTEQTEGTDFWPNYDMIDSDGNKVCNDGLLKRAGAWPTNPGTIKIVYISGYTRDELHGQDSVIDAGLIAEVIVDEAVQKAKSVFVKMKQSVGFVAGPLTSERMGDYSYTLAASAVDRLFSGVNDMLPSSKDKLRDFINYGYSLNS